MKRRLFFTAFFIIYLIIPTFAEEAATPLSFRDALLLADKKNPHVLVANERVHQAIQRIVESKSVFYPQVSGDAFFNRETQNLEAFGIKPQGSTSPVVGPFNVFDARIKLTQTLFDPASQKRLEAARAGEAVSLAEQKKTRQDVLALVATLYIEAKRASDALDTACAQVKVAEKKYQLALSGSKLGTHSEYEAKDALSKLSESRSRLGQALSDFKSKQWDLKTALGFSSDKSLLFSDDQFSLEMKLPKTKDLLEAAAANPDIAAAKALADQKKAEEAAANMEMMPKVSGAANYGASGVEFAKGEPTYLFGIQLSWPFFEGGRRQAHAESAKSQAREAMTNLKDVSNQQSTQSLKAKDILKNASLSRKAANDAMKAALQKTEIERKKLSNGSGNEMDYLSALADEAAAKDVQEESAAFYRIAQIKLLQSMGHVEQILES